MVEVAVAQRVLYSRIAERGSRGQQRFAPGVAIHMTQDIEGGELFVHRTHNARRVPQIRRGPGPP